MNNLFAVPSPLLAEALQRECHYQRWKSFYVMRAFFQSFLQCNFNGEEK